MSGAATSTIGRRAAHRRYRDWIGARACRTFPAHAGVPPSWAIDGNRSIPAGRRSEGSRLALWNQFHGPQLDQRRSVARRENRRNGRMTLLKWALIFFLVSIVAGILGFTGISAASADVARFLFYVFVVIFLVLLILGLTIFRV
jgi:uncharacterized membrane protein YtjA (UPF0391 family)